MKSPLRVILVWAIFFCSWFWLDSGLSDPAGWKNVSLPAAMTLILLVQGRIPVWNRFLTGAILFWCWSLLRLGHTETAPSQLLVLLGAGVAFWLGISGARPPVFIAMAAMGIAVGKGWDDILFVRNLGNGIPFTPTSFFVHRNIFAVILGPCLFLLSGWIFTQKEKLPRVVGCVLLALGTGLLFVIESRGAILGVFLALVIAYAYFLRIWWSSTSIRSVAVAAGILVGVLFLGQSGRITQTIEETRAVLSGGTSLTAGPDQFRPWVWIGAIRLWNQDPVGGIGIGNFEASIESVLDPWLKYFRNRSIKVGVAHSHWLQTLVERGIVGLLMETILFLGAVWSAYRSGRWALGSALVCMGVHGLVAEGMEFLSASIIWWYLIGAALSPQQLSRGRLAHLLVGGISVLVLVISVRDCRVVQQHEIIVSNVLAGSFPEDDLRLAIESAPHSPTLVLWIAQKQVEAGNLAGARLSLEYLRSTFPREGFADYELPLVGVWRQTGQLDSAKRLVARMLDLHPFDPWFHGEQMKILAQTRGCDSVRNYLEHIEPQVGGNLRKIDTTGGRWMTWQSSIAVDQDLVRAKIADLRKLDLLAQKRILMEWERSRTICLEVP